MAVVCSRACIMRTKILWSKDQSWRILANCKKLRVVFAVWAVTIYILWSVEDRSQFSDIVFNSVSVQKKIIVYYFARLLFVFTSCVLWRKDRWKTCVQWSVTPASSTVSATESYATSHHRLPVSRPTRMSQTPTPILPTTRYVFDTPVLM